MPHREPGFGPLPTGESPFLFGIILLIVWFATCRGRPRMDHVCFISGLIFSGVGAAKLWLARRDTQLARAAPPTARSDLTALLLAALNATPGDLLANARSQVPPEQWLRVCARTQLGAEAAVPPVRIAQGMARFDCVSPSARRASRVQVSIGDVAFPAQPPGLLRAIKRGGRYRVYFVDLPPRLAWGASPARVILAAEALADG